MSEAQIGEVIGGYRLDRKLAAGGMGVVYAATHKTLGRKAAVKVLSKQFANDDEFVSRFLHEARIANDLRHPCIVDIFDFVETDEPRRVACVMELLEGPTLHEVLRKGPLNLQQSLNVTLQVIDALKAAHDRGVVHRDLKPGNIVIVGALNTDLDAVPSAKILDFGIAKITEADVEHKTRTGSVMGTPAYMAPEQIAADEVSPSTDLYAIAEILFEMIAGRHVFRGNNLQILKQKMEKNPPRFELPTEVYGHDRLLALTSACLNPDPKRRPSLSDFETALVDLLDETAFGSEDATMLAAGAGDTTVKNQAPVPDEEIPNDFDTDAGMNTQMFFDRIVEDIEEPVVHETQPDPPMAPQEEAHLTLMRVPPGRTPSYTADALAPQTPSVPPRAPSIPPRPRAPSRAASVPGRPRVVVGKPAAPPRRKKSPVLLIAVALGLGLAGGAGWFFRSDLQTLIGDRGVSPLKADADKWASVHGAYAGRLQDLLATARKEIVRDQDDAYARTLEATKKLLVADAGHPAAIALYVEALALSAPENIDRAEHAKLKRAIEWALDGGEQIEDLERAMVALSTAVGHGAKAAGRLGKPTDKNARVRLAEALVESDPTKALEVIESDDATLWMPRATYIRATAMSRLGRNRAALTALDARKDTNAALLLLRAEIEAAAGLDRQAERSFKKAIEGKRTLAELRYGLWLMARGDTGAKKLLEGAANDKTMREALRAEASIALAELAMRAATLEEVDAQLSALEALRVQDRRITLLRAERALEAARPADAEKLVAPMVEQSKAPAPHVIRATAALAAGNRRRARRELEAAIQGATWDPRLRILLGAVHAAHKDVGSVRAVLDGLAELDPAVIGADERAIRVPRATWAEAEKQLLLAKAEPGLEDASQTLIALLGFYVNRKAADGALAKHDDVLAALAHRAQIALDRGATRTAQAHVRNMEKRAPKAIVTNLYAARIAAARGQHSTAIGIYDRILTVNDAALPRIERAASLAATNKSAAAGEIVGLVALVPHFQLLRSTMYEAGL